MFISSTNKFCPYPVLLKRAINIGPLFLKAAKSTVTGTVVHCAAVANQLAPSKPLAVVNSLPPLFQTGALQETPQLVETTTDNVSPKKPLLNNL